MSVTSTPNTDPFGVLRRVRAPRERPRPGEVCEMCGEALGSHGIDDQQGAGGEHSHVASLTERRLLCTCRACYLLFTSQGAGARRLRAVPERVAEPSDFAFTQAQWDDLAIPVDLVFFFHQSDLDDPLAPLRVMACYPSPAGATESELDLESWADLAAANPTIADVEPDVEAVLVRRTGDGEFACLIVPIDACYELVGLVRQYWSGFQGGDEVWQHIDGFFAALQARAGGARATGRRGR